MTGCVLCGVGPDDECAMDCPSRDRIPATVDGAALDSIAALVRVWLADWGEPPEQILAAIATQVIATGRRV